MKKLLIVSLSLLSTGCFGQITEQQKQSIEQEVHKAVVWLKTLSADEAFKKIKAVNQTHPGLLDPYIWVLQVNYANNKISSVVMKENNHQELVGKDFYNINPKKNIWAEDVQNIVKITNKQSKLWYNYPMKGDFSRNKLSYIEKIKGYNNITYILGAGTVPLSAGQV